MSNANMTEGSAMNVNESSTKKTPRVKKKSLAAKLAEKKRRNGSLSSLKSQVDHEEESNTKILNSKSGERNIPESLPTNEDVILVSTKHDKVVHVSNSSQDIRNESISTEEAKNAKDEVKNREAIDSTPSSSKPRPKIRRGQEQNRPRNPEPADTDEGFITGKSTGETDENIVSPSDSTPGRHRSLRLTHQRSESVESLKNGKFQPKPPTTPRKSPPKTVSRETVSSGEEVEVEIHKTSSPAAKKSEKKVNKESSPQLRPESPRLKPSDAKDITNHSPKSPRLKHSMDSFPVSPRLGGSQSSLKDVDRMSYTSDPDMRELQKSYEKLLHDKLMNTQSEYGERGSVQRLSPIATPSKPPLGKLAPLPPLQHHPISGTSSAIHTKNRPYKEYPSKLFERSDSAPMIAMDGMSQKSSGSVSALPVMTTKEARMRSKSDAGVEGIPALMGADELERYFPNRQIHVWIGSWNMKEMKTVDMTMTDFLLPETCKYVQNMYVVGSQENAMNKKEWEIHIQEVLGPTFVLFHSVTHGSLHLAVYIHRDLIWFCSVPEDDVISTRAVTMIKTKGAIGIAMSFFGTSMLFINSHLTPSIDREKNRILDYQKIISGLKFPKTTHGSSQDLTNLFDCVYWCGDLNFRIERPKAFVESKVNTIGESDIPDFEALIRGDQLTKLRTQGQIFEGFQEGRINFPPTYKYDVKTNNFDTSNKLRIPSYTDRILFRSKKKNHISCLQYDSVMSIDISDHKPVYGIYQMAVKPNKEFVMSAAGHFDKDVYMKANKRIALKKSESNTKSEKSSTICVIQ